MTAIDYGSANATWSLPRLVGIPRTNDILMTGRSVGGEEGFRIGLFDRLVADGQVPDCAIALAVEIAAKPKSAVLAVKALVNAAPTDRIDAAWLTEHNSLLAALTEEGRAGSSVFGAFLGKPS